jgi:hypothetical protein
MCTISFAKALHINIRNLYPGLELTFPVYCSYGTAYCIYSSQQTNTENTTEANLGIDFKQKGFRGALLYKLQKKYTTKTDKQPNNRKVFGKGIGTTIDLLVVWKIEDCNHRFGVCLVEHSNFFIRNKDTLWTLYWEYNNRFYKFCKPNIITWSMHNGEMMKTGFDITYGSEYKLDIVMSKGTWEFGIRLPMRVNLERSESSSSKPTEPLYGLSHPAQPLVKLNIHNQCLDIGLASPIYITHSPSEYYKTFDHRPLSSQLVHYKVRAGDTTKSSFTIDELDSEPLGALIYKLQKRQSHVFEIDKGTSNTTCLLVIWRIFEFKKLYADVLLAEHDKGFVWSKNNLKVLYCKNINWFGLHTGSATKTWLLDDNTALMITSEIMSEDRTLNITIAEVERYNDEKISAPVDLKR